MARGRLISKSLGCRSKKFKRTIDTPEVGEFAGMLYMLIVANSDDFGRAPGDAFSVKYDCFPLSDRTEDEFDQALDLLHEKELIVRYEVDGKQFLEVVEFDAHQPGLHKRTESTFPDPPRRSGLQELPGTSGKFPESPGTSGKPSEPPGNSRSTEPNRREPNRREENLNRTDTDTDTAVRPTLDEVPVLVDISESVGQLSDRDRCSFTALLRSVGETNVRLALAEIKAATGVRNRKAYLTQVARRIAGERAAGGPERASPHAARASPRSSLAEAAA